MIDLSDLGLEPVHSAATDNAAEVASNDNLLDDRKALVPGSMLARVLYAGFSRQPVTIVDSPPGAGKTTLVVEALEQLMKRSDFKVVVACPTRRGAADLAERLATELGDAKDAPQVIFSVSGADLPKGCVRSSKPDRRSIVVRTIASCGFSAPDCDIMVFDEAYQATFAEVMSASDSADQVILVGDPGQIGPVVTADTSAWRRMRSAPHMRAPEVFAQRDDAMVLQMDATYRLGQRTVDAIAPLYGFEFSSKRPHRELLDRDGSVLPEIAAHRVNPAPSTAHVDTMVAIADLAYAMVGRKVRSLDAEGNEVLDRVRESDVAVVVAHNNQSSTVSAILRSYGMEGIAVGTADRMQGGQWHAVIALDPLVGAAAVGPHQLNLGRLCVMASRHLTHMTWVHDGEWEPALRAAAEEEPDARTGIAVRRHMTA